MILNLFRSNFSSRLFLLDIPLLSNRRTILGIVFIQKLIVGDIDFSFLLRRLQFSVPSGPTRNYRPLFLLARTTDFTRHNSFRVSCMLFFLHRTFSTPNKIDTFKIPTGTHRPFPAISRGITYWTGHTFSPIG